MEKYFVSLNEVEDAVRELSRNIGSRDTIYGIPRGGVPIALMLSCLTTCTLVAQPEQASVIVDDIFDSGRTSERLRTSLGTMYVRSPRFYTAFDKRLPEWKDKWLVMPWEVSEQHDQSADDAVVRLLQHIGEDPEREGLRETPQRVIKAWSEWTAGYNQNPADILKGFEDGADKYDEFVFQGSIPFYSTCEHHLAPFFGVAHIGYIPTGRIVGLSKLSRLLDIFARRLQCQERISVQVADALMNALKPLGVGVVLQARHMCMESRGICKSGTVTTTSALRGLVKERPEVREEFLSFVSAERSR